MAWYRTGTVSVTNGSTSVSGSGTAWIANVAPGEALAAPDGRYYEIGAVTADGALALARPYLGATASGQTYEIVPIQGRVRDLAAEVAALVAQYGASMSNAGVGKFGDGTLAAPGVRFTNDENTGIRRTADGVYRLVSNGVDIAEIGPGGVTAVTGGFNGPVGQQTRNTGAFTEVRVTNSLGIGTDNPAAALHVNSAGAVAARLETTRSVGAYVQLALGGYGQSIGQIGSAANNGLGGTNDLAVRANGNLELQAVGALVLRPDGGTTVSEGHLQMGPKELRFDQPGARSWQTKAANGNLEFLSGDTLGSVDFKMVAVALNSLVRNAYYHDGTWRYSTGNSASLEQFDSGTRRRYFYSAPVGAAGSAVVWREDMRIDESNNLVVGLEGASATAHTFRKAPASFSSIFEIRSNTGGPGVFLVGGGPGVSVANPATEAAVYTGKSDTTGRSANLTGTLNASGADYAEYMPNDGFRFAKGEIVGVDVDGILTPHFAQAIRFRVKSTAPCLVGGDTWAQAAGPRPVEPQFAAPEYKGRGNPGEAPQAPQPTLVVAEDGAVLAQPPSAEALAAYEAASEAHQKAMADWRLDQHVHAANVEIAQHLFETATYPEYQRALAAWSASVEELRQGVDRIAFTGIVPCNVLGAQPGDYIVPAECEGGSIKGVAVPEADITFALYRKAVGSVQRILPDGRAEIAVIVH